MTSAAGMKEMSNVVVQYNAGPLLQMHRRVFHSSQFNEGTKHCSHMLQLVSPSHGRNNIDMIQLMMQHSLEQYEAGRLESKQSSIRPQQRSIPHSVLLAASSMYACASMLTIAYVKEASAMDPGASAQGIKMHAMGCAAAGSIWNLTNE